MRPVLRRSGSLVLGVALAAAVLPATGAAGAASPVRSRTATAAVPRTSPVTDTRPKLSWAPPRLTAPTVVKVGDGTRAVVLSPGRDYVLDLPSTRAVRRPEGLMIVGGRNVVLVGGSVDVRDGVVKNGEVVRRGLYLKGQTGRIHVEGVRFWSSTKGTLTEGVNLDQRLGATVVLQNIRLQPLVGSYAANHADGIQTWAGPRRLLVDGLWISTGYQGMFLLPNQHYSGPAPELFDLRRVSIVGRPGAGYLLWVPKTPFPFRTSKVYVRPGGGPGLSRSRYIWDRAGFVTGVTPVAAPPYLTMYAGARYTTPGYR